jgi:glycosyltransferase involved in cell wall biosynthesis
MLRVAMVTDHSDHDDKVDGGVQAVTKYLVRALTQLNKIDLHVISYRYDTDVAQTVAADGYSRYILPGRRFGTMTGYWRSQSDLDSLLDKIRPDIVHGQGVGHDGIVASRSKYPSVLTIHGILQEEARHFPTARRRMRHRMQNQLSKHYCIKNAKNTILISPYVGDYYGSDLRGQHYLIPNPIAPEFFELSRNEEPGRILFAGRLRALKGVIDLIRALPTIAKSQDIRLVLAGSLDDKEYVKQLRSEAERLHLSDIITFRGILDDRALRNEFSKAAVLVLPSYQETAPMVIQEAMASAVPVVASNVGGTRYQLTNNETGFIVDPGDVSALTDRLALLLSDESMRKSFGAAAKIRAREEYSAEKVALTTLDVYKQIIARPI